MKQAQAVLTGHSSSQRAQRAEQARARPSFGDWGWSNSRDRSAESSRSAQVAVFADMHLVNAAKVSVSDQQTAGRACYRSW